MADAYDEAGELMDNTQYEYAIFLLTDVINADYRTSEALCKRAMCYMNMSRYKEASEDLGNAIILDRTLVSAYVKQAKCYLAIGDLDNAIVSITSLTQVEPENAFAKCELEKLKDLKQKDKKAKKLFEEKNYAEVVKIMDQCLKNADICIRFRLMKAECLVYMGQSDYSLQIVNDVLFTHKDDVEAICIRAMNLLYQEKYSLGIIEIKEIATSYQKATNVYRQYKRIIENRKNADKALRNNKLDEAKKLYHTVLDIDNKNKNLTKVICTTIAEISFKQQLYNDAIEQSSTALEISSSYAKALKIRGDSNIQNEEYDLAIEDYNELLKLENNENNRRKIAEIQQKNKMIDNYTILGVTRDTSVSDIKKAYKDLAKIYHPDKNSQKSKYELHKCKVKFAKINYAYNELLKK